MAFHEFFIKLHPVVIHFVIVGYTLAFGFSLIGFLLRVVDRAEHIDLLERLSHTNFAIATISFPFTVITGMIDARSVNQAISSDLLAWKIILGMVVSCLILVTLILMFSASHNDMAMFQSTFLHLQHLLLTFLILVFISFIAALGGLYVFNHSLFDTFGLGFILPRTLDQPTSNLFPTVFEAIFYSPVMTGLLGIIFVISLVTYFRMIKTM